MTHCGAKIINEQELLKMIQKYGITSEFQDFLHKKCRLGGVEVKELNMTQIFQLCLKLNLGSQKSEKKEKKQSTSFLMWKKGQYKLFLWFLCYYIFYNKNSLQQMDSLDFAFLASVFQTHSPLLIEYEVRCMINSSQNKKSWNETIDDIFKKLTSQYQKSNKKIEWKVVSFQLFRITEKKVIQTPKQCRQRWMNYYDPDLVRKQWTHQEQLQLFQLVQELGSQWAKIAKRLKKKRTDHMVKNRYFSIIEKWKKKLNVDKDTNKKQIIEAVYKNLKEIIYPRESLSLSNIENVASVPLEENQIHLKSLLSNQEMINIFKVNLLSSEGSFHINNNDSSEYLTLSTFREEKKEEMRLLHQDILSKVGFIQQPFMFLEQNSLEHSANNSIFDLMY